MYKKTKKDILKYILKKHLLIKDNLFMSQRFFIINLLLDWVFENTSNSKVISFYVADLEKYVSETSNPKWIQDFLDNKERRANNDHEITKRKEKSG